MEKSPRKMLIVYGWLMRLTAKADDGYKESALQTI